MKKSKLLLTLATVFLSMGFTASLAQEQKELKLDDPEFVLNKWWDEIHSNETDLETNTLKIHGRPGDDSAGEYYGGQAGWVFTTPISVDDYDKLVVKIKNEGPAVVQIRVFQDGVGEAFYDFAVSEETQNYEFDLKNIYKGNITTDTPITTINSVYFWGYWGGGNTIVIDEIYFEKEIVDPTESVYTDKYFPLSTEEGFNIELWNPKDETNNDVKYNAFDNATKQLTLGNYNAAGWTFNNGEDFSKYKYAVVVLNQPQTCGLQFRLFDENNYFSKCTEDAFNDNFYLTLELNKLFKRDADKPDGIGDKLDPSHIYIAAFWSYTGTSSISNVFLTNVEPNWAKPEARSTTSGNYGTVCLPYPAVCTNGYVYTIAGKDAEGTTLYLEPYNGVMRPGTPYIYKSIGEGVKFYQLESEDAQADEALTYNGLVGCFNTTTQGDTYYALGSNNQWVKMDANVTFKNRAYLDLSSVPTLEEEEPSVANVAMRVIPGTTGIETVQQDETTDDQAIYTLSGIRVDDGAKLGRGIYIRGGKKFIVK